MVKRIIRKAKRFIHSIKVRWKIMRSLRHWAAISYGFQMTAYDMAQALKRMRPASGQCLNNKAKVAGTERMEGKTDNDIQKRIIKIHKQASQTPAWFAPEGGRKQ